jgi:ceramide glucosyltransferase
MSALVIGLAGLHLLVHWLMTALALVQLRPPRRGTTGIGQPHVTLLRPVCGLDPMDRQTLTSGFTQDYPSYDLIFCTPSQQDPAVPLLRDLIAAYPLRRATILVGLDPSLRNPRTS